VSGDPEVNAFGEISQEKRGRRPARGGKKSYFGHQQFFFIPPTIA